MRLIDASAILDLWEFYPLDVFPPVWAWIEEEIAGGNLRMPKVNVEEVVHKSEECGRLIMAYGLVPFEVGDAELRVAIAIKEALGIEGDNYGAGVDEKDIILIACAVVARVDLVTSENIQTSLPAVMAKYKIPAVCALPSVGVRSMRVIDLLRASGRVFR